MPPGTLFRYIAWRTIAAIGGLVVVLASLVMMIDLIENLRIASKTAGGDFRFAVTLTLLRAPALTQVLTPFVFLFGSIWMFHQLNRRSEIAVMRSAGLSVWKLIGPAALISAVAGIMLITLIDPVSSQLYRYAEQIRLEHAGKENNFVRVFNDGIWLRQRAAGMQVIINARATDADRSALSDVTVWRFDSQSQFLERIDASRATFSGGTMELHDARLVASEDLQPRRTPLYAIPTALSSNDFKQRVAAPETMSLWQLPHYVLLAESAGLPTVRYNIRFHDLCSTPLKLLAMVLIAAAFSMRPTRSSGVLQLIALSIAAGFLLYLLSEISSAFGESELAPVAMAAWAPAVVATLAALTALLHLEDG